jgi:hypothetical protein
MARKKYATVADRIRMNVEIDDASGCWNWQRRINRGGYGIGNHFIDGARVTYRAHRLSYETFVGPVSPGLSLDHLCRNRRCANPAHLEPVPQRVNLMRAPLSIASQNAAKTHCKWGHPFDEDNTLYRATGRSCRACNRDRQTNRALRAASVPSERAA